MKACVDGSAWRGSSTSRRHCRRTQRACNACLRSKIRLHAALLNPHVYIDTLLLVGSVGAQHAGVDRVAFVGGSVLASALWFHALDLGARWLAPLFVWPQAWQWLDVAVGLSMLGLGARLLRQGAVDSGPARGLGLSSAHATQAFSCSRFPTQNQTLVRGAQPPA